MLEGSDDYYDHLVSRKRKRKRNEGDGVGAIDYKK